MIKVLKLITGEEIIADVEELGNGLTLRNPARLAIHGQGAILVPWLMLTQETNFEILKSHVLFEGDADAELVNGYNQQFGNGLVIAGNEGLIVP